MIKNFLILAFITLIFNTSTIAKGTDDGQNAVAYTQADRDRSIRIEATMEQMDKRFDQIDKRFDQMNKRIDDLRADTKEQFDTLKTFLGWIVGLFGSMFIFIIGLVFWDRYTLLRPIEKRVKTVELEIEVIQKDTSLTKIMVGLRQLGKTNPQVQEFLKNNNLL